jgi:hypothetical protein
MIDLNITIVITGMLAALILTLIVSLMFLTFRVNQMATHLDYITKCVEYNMEMDRKHG